jgi:hypothetical protein
VSTTPVPAKQATTTPVPVKPAKPVSTTPVPAKQATTTPVPVKPAKPVSTTPVPAKQATTTPVPVKPAKPVSTTPVPAKQATTTTVTDKSKQVSTTTVPATNDDDDNLDSDSDDTEEQRTRVREARIKKAAKKGTNPAAHELTQEDRLKQTQAKEAASAKPAPTTTDDAEPVVQISLIDRVIKTASNLEKAFQSKSGDKTWVIVMENGDVKSGNLKNMKTALNKVGVTDEITFGLKDVKKFEKHELGQAYHISKSMLTKALGIDEGKLNGMANADKWEDDMAVKLLMLDFPDVPKKT